MWNNEGAHPLRGSLGRLVGAFDMSALTDAENADIASRRTWFWLGEVAMTGILAGVIAVPTGIWFAGRTVLSLAFIGAAVLFLPKLTRRGMKADTDAVIEAFGKNDQVKKVFWALFVAMAGLVLARVLDPATVQQIVGIIIFGLGTV